MQNRQQTKKPHQHPALPKDNRERITSGSQAGGVTNVLQCAAHTPGALTPVDIPVLQGALGNRTVGKVLRQSNLTPARPGYSAPATAGVVQRGFLDDATSLVSNQAKSAAGWAGNQADSAASWAGNQANNAAGWVGNQANSAAGWAGDKANSAAGWVGNQADSAAGWVGDKADSAAGWVGDKADTGKIWAKEQINSARQSLENVAESL